MKKIILFAILAICSQSIFANSIESQKKESEQKQLVEKKYQCVSASTSIDSDCLTLTITVEICGDDICPEDVAIASILAHNEAIRIAHAFEEFSDIVC